MEEIVISEMASKTSDFVLIVDDNAANLSVLAQTLKGAGCAVRVAVDGESAIQQVAEELPSLILLDIMMPGIDGLETCRRLKKNSDTCEVPIIFMTVLDDIQEKVHGLSLGAVDYITKPFNESEVLARVLAHLKTHDLIQTVQEQNHQLKHEIALRKEVEQQLNQLNNELQRVQIELLQKERLSAIAELVTGIASEINNPIGCIAGNIEFVKKYTNSVLDHIALYEKYEPHNRDEIEQHTDEIELDYLKRDLPAAIESIQGSTGRISAVSKLIQIFNRHDIKQNKKYEFDIHELLDGALLLLRHRLKTQNNRAAIEITKTYGDLPNIPCFPGRLSQAFTNVLGILIDAFDEHCSLPEDESVNNFTLGPGGTPLRIQIRTTIETSWAIIRIRGNTSSMWSDHELEASERDETHNPIHNNADLELLMARQIVVETHGGELNFISTFNTEIMLMLPASRTGQKEHFPEPVEGEET